MKQIRLSYDLTPDTPYPAGLWPVTIEHKHDMDKGAISNVFMMHLHNHVGTHVDGPNHFSTKKKALHEFPIETFVFDKPLLLDIPRGDSELIAAGDLAAHAEAIEECDLLLLRTGFGKIRGREPERYAGDNPGIDASAARFLADETPNVRALGIDCVSFAALRDPREGIRAHQILMDECARDVFLIEDMDLDHDLGNLNRVYALPLYVAGIDSAPCTILALIEE